MIADKPEAMRKLNLLKVLSIMIGILFLISGIWGFSSRIVFGMFTTNILHAIFQMIIGCATIFFASVGYCKLFLKILGSSMLLLGFSWFMGGDQMLIQVFNTNRSFAFFNLLFGFLVLVLAITLKSAQSRQHNSVDIVF